MKVTQRHMTVWFLLLPLCATGEPISNPYIPFRTSPFDQSGFIHHEITFPPEHKRSKIFHSGSTKHDHCPLHFSLGISKRWHENLEGPAINNPPIIRTVFPAAGPGKQVVYLTQYEHLDLLSPAFYEHKEGRAVQEALLQAPQFPLLWESSSFHGSPVLHDVNGDGIMDVIVADYDGGISIMALAQEPGKSRYFHHFQVPRLYVRRNWIESRIMKEVNGTQTEADDSHRDPYHSYFEYYSSDNNEEHILRGVAANVLDQDESSAKSLQERRGRRVSHLDDVKPVIEEHKKNNEEENNADEPATGSLLSQAKTEEEKIRQAEFAEELKRRHQEEQASENQENRHQDKQREQLLDQRQKLEKQMHLGTEADKAQQANLMEELKRRQEEELAVETTDHTHQDEQRKELLNLEEHKHVTTQADKVQQAELAEELKHRQAEELAVETTDYILHEEQREKLLGPDQHKHVTAEADKLQQTELTEELKHRKEEELTLEKKEHAHQEEQREELLDLDKHRHATTEADKVQQTELTKELKHRHEEDLAIENKEHAHQEEKREELIDLDEHKHVTTEADKVQQTEFTEELKHRKEEERAIENKEHAHQEEKREELIDLDEHKHVTTEADKVQQTEFTEELKHRKEEERAIENKEHAHQDEKRKELLDVEQNISPADDLRSQLERALANTEASDHTSYQENEPLKLTENQVLTRENEAHIHNDQELGEAEMTHRRLEELIGTDDMQYIDDGLLTKGTADDMFPDTDDEIGSEGMDLGKTGKEDDELPPPYLDDDANYGRERYDDDYRRYTGYDDYYGDYHHDDYYDDKHYIRIPPHVLTTPVLVEMPRLYGNNEIDELLLVAATYYFDEDEYEGRFSYKRFSGSDHGDETELKRGMYVASAILAYNLEHGGRWSSQTHLELSTDFSSPENATLVGTIPIKADITEMGAFALASPTVADIDGDGTLDVLLGTSMGLLYALDCRNLFKKENWPIQMKNPIESRPLVEDVVGDTNLEVFVVDIGGIVACYSHEGKLIWSRDILSSLGFGKSITGASPMSLGDVDGDGYLDLVMTVEVNGRWLVLAFQAASGNDLKNFPIELEKLRKAGKFKNRESDEKKERTRLAQPLLVDLHADQHYILDYIRRGSQAFRREVDIAPSEYPQGGSSAGIHIVQPMEKQLYIVEGGSGCTQKVVIGEEIGTMVGVDDIHGTNHLDLLVATKEGNIVTLESSANYHPLNTWTGGDVRGKNSHTHGYSASQGIFVHEVSRQYKDIFGVYVPVTFEVFDNRPNIDQEPGKRIYKIEVRDGSSSQRTLHRVEVQQPGVYTERIYVRFGPGYYNLCVLMSTSHGITYEDCFATGYNVHFMAGFGVMLWLPLLVSFVTILLCGVSKKGNWDDEDGAEDEQESRDNRSLGILGRALPT